MGELTLDELIHFGKVGFGRQIPQFWFVRHSWVKSGNCGLRAPCRQKIASYQWSGIYHGKLYGIAPPPKLFPLFDLLLC